MTADNRLRRLNRRANCIAVALMLVLSPSLAHSAEPASGASLAQEKGCVACHGLDGVAIAPNFPNLAGQWERYLRLQLRAYRSGKRQNEIMAGFAGQLSDDEIRTLARFYGDD